MAELYRVNEIQEDVETRLSTRPESEFPDRQDLAVQNYGDDEDGCKTPTSPDHKIPEIKQCPPAPRKPKPNRPAATKRKLKSPENVSVNSRIPIYLSREIESFFEELDRRIKKSRRQQDDKER